MTYSNATLVIDRIHRMLGEEALQIRPLPTTTSTTVAPNEIFNSQTCMTFGRIPSSQSSSTSSSSSFVDPHDPNLETQWQWCFYPATMTSSSSSSSTSSSILSSSILSSISQPSRSIVEENTKYIINDEDTEDNTWTWPTLDEVTDIIGYGLLVTFYYIGCASNSAAAQVRWVSMPPPRIITYGMIRIHQGYGSTDKTPNPSLLSSVTSEEDDNMPLGLRYPNNRINHLSVSAPASASTQHLASSLSSGEEEEEESAIYTIPRLPYPDTSTNNTIRSEEEEEDKGKRGIIESTNTETMWSIDSTECPICLERFLHHTFHVGCIERWLHRRRPTCPMCRAPVPVHRDHLNLLESSAATSASASAASRLTDDRLYSMNNAYAPSRRAHRRIANNEGNEGERRPLLFNR
ncbi:hypothetical protein BDF22DRAFT_739922 [Syncephalis plumigaleata]|nr:hypothetical protein BDF22DRAFT_739922 [Syncephalis plumigaleata]